MADGADTTSDDTPTGGNVSDGTPPATGAPAPNGQNDNATSTPASTQRNDTPSIDALFSKFADRIDALPESIVNAIKEAAPSQQSSAPPPDNSTSTAGSGSGNPATDGNGASTASTDTPPTRSRSEKFASWWFGK